MFLYFAKMAMSDFQILAIRITTMGGAHMDLNAVIFCHIFCCGFQYQIIFVPMNAPCDFLLLLLAGEGGFWLGSKAKVACPPEISISPRMDKRFWFGCCYIHCIYAFICDMPCHDHSCMMATLGVLPNLKNWLILNLFFKFWIVKSHVLRVEIGVNPELAPFTCPK